MNNPFLNNFQLRLLYTAIWAVIIIAQIGITGYYWGVDGGGQTSPLQVGDALASNLLQAVCILALWYPVKYYRNIVNIPLFLLFHISLIVISFAIWLGLGYWLVLIGSSQHLLYTPYFMAILPVRIMTGVFLYIIFVLTYYLFLHLAEIKAQKQIIEETKNNSASAPAEKLTRVSVKKNQEIHCIPVHQIQSIEASGDYVIIYTSDNKYLKDRTMKYWETHLPEDSFVRIHRSFILNIEWIAKIELYEKDSYKIQLKNGNSLKASSAGYKLLKQKMQL